MWPLFPTELQNQPEQISGWIVGQKPDFHGFPMNSDVANQKFRVEKGMKRTERPELRGLNHIFCAKQHHTQTGRGLKHWAHLTAWAWSSDSRINSDIQVPVPRLNILNLQLKNTEHTNIKTCGHDWNIMKCQLLMSKFKVWGQSDWRIKTDTNSCIDSIVSQPKQIINLFHQIWLNLGTCQHLISSMLFPRNVDTFRRP